MNYYIVKAKCPVLHRIENIASLAYTEDEAKADVKEKSPFHSIVEVVLVEKGATREEDEAAKAAKCQTSQSEQKEKK